MAITRHLGTLTATGSRCVVVFRELPGEPQTCLVFESDSMPEYYREPMMTVILNEGQRHRELFEVLHRNHFSNGQVMLTAIHNLGYLRPKPTSDVMMELGGNTRIRLDELNDQLRELDAETKKEEVKTDDIQAKFNPMAENTAAEEATVAGKLLREAEKLELEAASKRKRAHTLDPSIVIVEADGHREFKVDVGSMPMEEAIDLLEQLKDKFGIQPSVAAEPLPKGVVTVDLNKSQRQVLEEVKAAWRAQNPDKAK